MDVKLNIKVKPFTVPNFIIRVTDNGDVSIPLSDLDIPTLEVLCREFKTSVFTKAKLPAPPVMTAR